MTALHLRELRMELSRNFPLLPRSMRLPLIEIIPEKNMNYRHFPLIILIHPDV
jgi:hypothetical protein